MDSNAAYIFFCNTNRARVREANTNEHGVLEKQSKEIMTILGQQWRCIDDEEKKVFAQTFVHPNFHAHNMLPLISYYAFRGITLLYDL